MEKAKRERASIYVDSEAFAIVQAFAKRTGESVSSLCDGYLQQMASYLKLIGADKKEKFTRADLLKLAFAGVGEMAGVARDIVRRQRDGLRVDEQLHLPVDAQS